ncbi:MAG: UDP-N-acetylmuramoyl-tripeptide--D-alanyl-D-alanine ligase, partial [Armatimonadetes bacterium]|nr:UDP-N-acetylmuramoyl-tripeptide--D-alanyl-D-alanine ligase [Armatimonadota bacterium]
TTKSMLAEILRRVAATVSTPGTENNEIGVPLTLLATRDEKYCVLEFGARGLGHIAYLAGIARPDIGIITNIGQAHLGLFGSPEKVARAKAELLEALPEHGTAVLPADDAFFEQLCQRCHCRVVSFGFGEADFRAGDVALRGEGVAFVLRSPVGTAEIKLRVPGRHNALNALAAAAAAWAGGASLDAIVDGLQAFEGEPMRTEIVRLADGTLVINDAYNASPTSVAAALELLSSYSGRKVFVFGDMLELGDHAAAAHRQVGQAAVSAGVAVLIAVGELAAMAADEASRLGIRTAVAANPSEAVPVAAELVRPGDIVLVKASRLVGLEAVVRALEEARGRA